MRRKWFGATLASAALALTMAAPVAAQNQAGNSLINVQISDVTIQVPIAIAANLCDINVNVLARQARSGDPNCEATAESIATPGPGAGGGNQAGDSLVNVQVSDLVVQLPVGVAANVCDVNVNVLAEQLRLGEATCEAVALPQA